MMPRQPTPQPSRSRTAGEWRRLAITFANEADQWGEAELLAFCRALLASGDLEAREPLGGHLRVREGGASLLLDTSPWSEAPTAAGATSSCRELLVAAVDRVRAALRHFSATPQDDRFLHAALFSGRVQRVPHRVGGPTWEPRLREGEPISEWVLALVAADALEDRDAWDARLEVCVRCGFATLDGLGEHGCEARTERGGEP